MEHLNECNFGFICLLTAGIFFYLTIWSLTDSQRCRKGADLVALTCAIFSAIYLVIGIVIVIAGGCRIY